MKGQAEVYRSRVTVKPIIEGSYADYNRLAFYNSVH